MTDLKYVHAATVEQPCRSGLYNDLLQLKRNVFSLLKLTLNEKLFILKITSFFPGMNAAVRAVVRMGLYVGAKVYFIHEVSPNFVMIIVKAFL